MNIFRIVIKKELLQLLRNPVLLIIILGCPIVVMGVIPYAMGNKAHIRLIWIDDDNSAVSRKIGSSLQNSPYFTQITIEPTLDKATEAIDKGEADIVLQVPSGFEKQLILTHPLPLAIAVDGTHTLSAQNNLYYLTQTINNCIPGSTISTECSIYPMFSQSNSNRSFFIVSLLVLLITILGISLITLSIVMEKENGVFEQLHSTVLRWDVYLSAKITFYIVFCLLELLVGLLLCRVFHGFIITGALFEFFFLALFFLIPVLGIGLFISGLSKSQLQAAYLIIFSLLTLILMSSMFSLLQSMPKWAQALRYINPVYMMLDASRLIGLKGFSLKETIPQLTILLIQGVTISFFGIRKIKRL